MQVKFNDVYNYNAIGPSPVIDSEEFIEKTNLTWIQDGQEKYIKFKVYVLKYFINVYDFCCYGDLRKPGGKV